MNLPTAASLHIKENAQISQVLNLAVPIASIVISFFVVLFVVWPKIHEIFSLRENNKQLVVRAETLEKKAEVLSGLDKGKLENQLVAAEQLLPSDKNVFSLLRQIEATAGQTGVLLNRVDAVAGTINEGAAQSPIAPPIAPQALQNQTIAGSLAPSVEVRLSATSDYASLLKFLSSLYSFSRVVSTDSVSLSAAVGESLQISTSFVVNAYWKSLPSELGSIENPVENLTPGEDQLLAKVSKPEALQAPSIPTVPTGRNDLFTPF